MLLMVAISLLMVNILLLYFLRPTNTKGVNAKSKNKTENVVIQKYETTIDGLKSEIQSLKSKITDLTQPKEEQKEEKVEQTKPTPTISKEKAKKRQEELIKAGYKVSADGIWGAQSEKTWNKYQQKKKV